MTTRVPSPGVDPLLMRTIWVRRLARKLGADAAAAEDAAQDVWLAARRHPPDPTRPLGAWVRQVLRRQLINRAVETERRSAREIRAAEHGAKTSPDDVLSRAQAYKAVVDAVMALAPPAREVVLLRYFDDLSSAEIARRLRVPPGTVRWRLHEALKELRRALDAQHGADHRAWVLAIAAAHRGRGWLWVGGTVVMAAALIVLRAPRRAPNHSMVSQVATVPSPTMPQTTNGSPQELAACYFQLTRAVHEAEALEDEAISRALPHEVFLRGSHNPHAERALQPAIARTMRFASGAVPSYVFECRTFACRVTVLNAREDREQHDNWWRALRTDGELGFRGFGFYDGGSVLDPLSRQQLERQYVFMILPSARGKAVPVPPTLRGCQAARSRADARTHEATADILLHQAPTDALDNASAQPNAALMNLVNAELAGAWPASEAPAMVACVNTACRFSSEGMLRLKRAATKAQRRAVLRLGHSQGNDVAVFDESTTQMRRHLFDTLEEFRTSQPIRICIDSASSAKGTMFFKLSRLGGPVDSTTVTWSPEYSGSLVGTPIGRCFAAAFERFLETTDLPTNVREDGIVTRLELPGTL